MYYFIQHENKSTPYLFQSDDQYAIGDIVICDTRRGNVRGVIIEFFMTGPSLAKAIAKACHAYWPLAKIIRKYTPPIVTSIDEVPQEIIEQIRLQEVNRIIRKLRIDEGDYPVPKLYPKP